jgi:hypothetical protein
MRVQDAADIHVIRIHGRVHSDHGALDGWQLAFEQGSVQTDPHHGGWGVVPERRATGEVHLVRPGNTQAHVPMPVRGDRSAGDDTLGDIDNLVDQILVHDTSLATLWA